MDFFLALTKGNFAFVGALDAVKVTLILGFSSTGLSGLIGIPLGLLLERYDFPGKRIVVRLNRTMMAMPPVVAGLMVYLLLMRRGPLGSLSLLFTIPGMVIAQTLIITPIVCGMVYTYAVKTAPGVRIFAITMGATKWQTTQLILREMKNDMYFSILTGFNRSISEVGAVMLVGGNIRGRTRTMTTAISLLKSQGIFEEGIALGITLMVMAFLLQTAADSFRREEKPDENF